MEKKLLVIVLPGMILTGLLAGCGVQTHKDSVIVTMPVSAEPEDGFDPIHGWGAGEHIHEPLIQSTLTSTTVDLKLQNDLAVDYNVSEDGLTWTVDIREDVRFTDGEKLTAKDVAFTYNQCRNSRSLNDLSKLKEAEAVDENTVEFHMNEPFNIWPYTMSEVGIVPEHAYSETYGKNPVGSGRYVLRQWKQGEQAVFEANPDYYGDEIKTKKFTVLFMNEEESLKAAQTGKTDVAYTSADYADQDAAGYQLQELVSVETFGFNLPAVKEREEEGISIGNDVTADLTIRRAINIGIDREDIVEKILKEYGTPAYGICDKMPWYKVDAEVSYAPEEARQLLEGAGWTTGADGIREKDGLKAEFTMLYDPSDSICSKLAGEISAQLEEIGIRVKLSGADRDVIYNEAQTKAVIWGLGSHTPMELYNLYHSERESKYAKYSPYFNSAVDKYMDKALEAPSLETSYEFWLDAQWDGKDGINGDLPWIWICSADHLYFVKDALHIGEQKVHPHGQGWSLVNNVDQWEWKA